MKVEYQSLHAHHRLASVEKNSHRELDALFSYEIIKLGENSTSSKEFSGGNGAMQMKSFLYQEWARMAALSLAGTSASIVDTSGASQDET